MKNTERGILDLLREDKNYVNALSSYTNDGENVRNRITNKC